MTLVNWFLFGSKGDYHFASCSNWGFLLCVRILRCWNSLPVVSSKNKIIFEIESDEFFCRNSRTIQSHLSPSFYPDHRLRGVQFLGPEESSSREKILLAEPTLLSTIPEASSLSTEVLFPCCSGERVCINLLVSHLSEICVWLYCCIHHSAVW